MALSYLAPDVYVEEVSSGTRSITGVGTSTAGFVGLAPEGGAHLNQPMAVNSWTEFVNLFGYPAGADQRTAPPPPNTPLAQAVCGFFDNGGRRCIVVNVGPGNPIYGDGVGRKGLDVLETMDEVSIVAAPGACDPASVDALITHCEKMRNRFALIDPPPQEDLRSLQELIRVGQVGAADPAERGWRGRMTDGGFAAQYFPRLRVKEPFHPRRVVEAAPSGYMAGVYARCDAERGVHKAPANETVRGALGLSYAVTRQEQELLNPAGINCIRFFPGEGIRIWGARTLAASSSEWRYVNVRRLFIMVEESIARATRWVVFEPNDATLWKRIVRDVRAFLTLVWRDGALMGTTADQAFFVKCDAETNPPEVVDAGRVVILIGMAPVKPAEFVIFRIGQGVAGAEVEVDGEGPAA